MGRSGGAAKVETKQAKKEIHERWNARMCGAAKENRRNSVDLCSESTGRANSFVEDSSEIDMFWTLITQLIVGTSLILDTKLYKPTWLALICESQFTCDIEANLHR